jgi:uncharacterized protein (DUF697 family)
MNKKLISAAIDLVNNIDEVGDQILPAEIVEIVKLHAKLAVGAALIPVPGLDMISSATAIWTMYVRINNKLNIPVAENVAKTIASGMATNLAAYGAALLVGSTLKFIPGIGTLSGTLVMLGTVYALTLTSGYIYLKALSAMAAQNNGNIIFEAEAIKKTIHTFFSENKAAIKEFMNDAKKEYKENKNQMKVSEEEQREFNEKLKAQKGQ